MVNETAEFANLEAEVLFKGLKQVNCKNMRLNIKH